MTSGSFDVVNGTFIKATFGVVNWEEYKLLSKEGNNIHFLKTEGRDTSQEGEFN